VTAVVIFMMSLISEQVCQMRYERRAGTRKKIRKLESADKDLKP
jgi:hypothetical protein